MKKIFFALFFVFSSHVLFAQLLNPVDWTVTSKKINDKVYEVHLIATINKGWHIYSQNTPDGGPVPTTITFTKNPLLDLDGKVKESGKLEQRHEEIFGVDVKQFSDKVEFIQVIKLKTRVKTSAKISVEYMVCNDRQCLPPVTKNFSIAL
ncbi:MAG: protein-disulfide reductase DsbD domain-containing protein [Ginsengibacter sp.]